MCWLVQWEHTTPPDSNQYPCWLTQNMSERGREEVETLRWDGRYRDRMDGGDNGIALLWSIIRNPWQVLHMYILTIGKLYIPK